MTRTRSNTALFFTRKPIIGVVHLLPLPGSPDERPMSHVLQRAVADALTWKSAGADALIVENFGDRPFYPEQVPPLTIAGMSRALAAVKDRCRLPLGVNVLRNDAAAALALAEAFDLTFIRVNVHAGVQVADQGLLIGRAHDTLRQRARMRNRPWILADLRVKHSTPLVERDLAIEAEELVERCSADVVLLTGPTTGRPPTIDQVACVKSAVANTPLLLASGVDPPLVTATRHDVSGWIVGTYAQGGRAGSPPKAFRIRRLLEARDRSLARPISSR